MRLVAFALCVQSLLQILPLALAKPDFGIILPITSSGKVSLAALAAQTVLEAVDDNTPYTVQANFKGTQDLANAVVNIASVTVTVGSEIVPLVTSLVSDVSGNVDTVFSTVLTKIAEVKSKIGTQLPLAIGAIKTVFKTQYSSEGLDYIPKMLIDGFNRIVLGLDDLTTTLNALKKAIENAVAAAGTEPLTDLFVKKNVKPAFLYNVVFAINQLKAYLPVIKYTIDSTLENINLADKYLLLVGQAVQQSAATTTQSINSVKIVTDAIAEQVKTNLNGYSMDFGVVKTHIGGLAQLAGSTNIGKVNDALASYTTTFGKLSTVRYPAMDKQLSDLIDAMSKALGKGTTPGQISSDLLDSLILTVIENGKYAQFCFNKYFGLVFGFLTTLGDSAGLCFDKEIPRLTTLQNTLLTIWQLLVADYEELVYELSVCDSLTAPGKLDECALALSGFYAALATEFENLMQSLFEVIESEAVASTNRFLICIELVKINLVEMSETTLTNDIRSCAKDGPTADD
ncbi:uncharacterized protein LOC126562104 [Anopheles maculipalpis]|uniref:uncharacterized protein LOC126562104 n=1 Tax=Anopheles maculipalpis TaxID=1496333 RepID=UPI002158C16D|nr:uncharacterized protein LOC126562104 [Anopheles maculipalpis]